MAGEAALRATPIPEADLTVRYRMGCGKCGVEQVLRPRSFVRYL